MKRTAIDHPKIRRLGKLLGIQHCHSVGVVECIWQFTAKHAMRGDIGKWTNLEIADDLGWPAEDADRLIQALVDCRLLDPHPEHRLIVHDWPGSLRGLSSHELDASRADAAAMREVLSQLRGVLYAESIADNDERELWEEYHRVVVAALSSTAGTALLAELEQLRAVRDEVLRMRERVKEGEGKDNR